MGFGFRKKRKKIVVVFLFPSARFLTGPAGWCKHRAPRPLLPAPVVFFLPFSFLARLFPRENNFFFIREACVFPPLAAGPFPFP